jgi:hypothetical protein
MATTVRLDLTPAQARMVNSALAMLEAEEHDYSEGRYRQDVMDRTRAAVHAAMERAGVEP